MATSKSAVNSITLKRKFKATYFSGSWRFVQHKEPWEKRLDKEKELLAELNHKLGCVLAHYKAERLRHRIRNCEARIVALKLTYL